MHLKLFNTNENGMTLLEVMFQIVIFAIFAQLVVLFFHWKITIEKEFERNAFLQTELFALDLQKEIKDVQDIVEINNGSGLRFQTDRGIITIERSRDVIRKAIYGQGHVPLITEITDVHFSLVYPHLRVSLQLTTGMKWEREFIVGANY